MSTLAPATKQEDGDASAESKNSSAPLLSKANREADEPLPSVESAESAKPRKRDFWKLNKKQEEEKPKQQPASISPSPHTSAPQIPPMVGLRPSSPFRINEPLAGAASTNRSHPYGAPTSPAHPVTSVTSASPRPHSPASSMIFERNVQDETHPPEISPQIPAHVITENHIPPALDASAEAITNAKLNPDEVEIITHATHQSAAVTITGTANDHSLSSSGLDDLQPHTRSEPDDMSNYGSLDSADVRRLSFISFADVVHAEQEQVSEHRRDSAILAGNALQAAPRSPSPIRSPVSSQAFGTSPPTSVATSAKGFEGSPSRAARAAGSPPLPGQASPLGGELNIETMRQALRRTGSGDLGSVRSPPLSAVGDNDGGFTDRPFR